MVFRQRILWGPFPIITSTQTRLFDPACSKTRLDSTRLESGNLCANDRVELRIMLDRKFRVQVEQIGLLDRNARNARNLKYVKQLRFWRLLNQKYMTASSILSSILHNEFDHSCQSHPSAALHLTFWVMLSYIFFSSRAFRVRVERTPLLNGNF